MVKLYQLIYNSVDECVFQPPYGGLGGALNCRWLQLIAISFSNLPLASINCRWFQPTDQILLHNIQDFSPITFQLPTL
jgi:hypothetical protein